MYFSFPTSFSFCSQQIIYRTKENWLVLLTICQKLNTIVFFTFLLFIRISFHRIRCLSKIISRLLFGVFLFFCCFVLFLIRRRLWMLLRFFFQFPLFLFQSVFLFRFWLSIFLPFLCCHQIKQIIFFSIHQLNALNLFFFFSFVVCLKRPFNKKLLWTKKKNKNHETKILWHNKQLLVIDENWRQKIGKKKIISQGTIFKLNLLFPAITIFSFNHNQKF